MPKSDDFPILDEKPQKILGVPDDANTAEIRTAYLNKIKEYPPEKFPAEFERVRDAYTIMNNPRYRTRMMLQSANPEASFMTLLDNRKSNRKFVGPDAWLAAMREQ